MRALPLANALFLFVFVFGFLWRGFFGLGNARPTTQMHCFHADVVHGVDDDLDWKRPLVLLTEKIRCRSKMKHYIK